MIRYFHGSKDSLDNDVYYVFDSLPSFRDCQEFCSSKEENRNIITIKDGIVDTCFKGTVDEINNGLIYTYPLHNQEYELLITRFVERDLLIKSIRVLRCLLSHCSRTEYRNIVKRALNSSSWNERLKILENIDFNTIEDFGKSGSKQDVLKVLAFQLGQIIGLYNNIELYTKGDIAKQYFELNDFLYRKNDTNINILVKYIKQFIYIINNYNVGEYNNICYFNDFDKRLDLRTEKYL